MDCGRTRKCPISFKTSAQAKPAGARGHSATFIMLLFGENSVHALFDVCVGCGHSADTILHPDWLNNGFNLRSKGIPVVHSSSPFH